MPGGGPSYRPDPKVIDDAIEISKSPKFIKRARELNFSEDVIAELPALLREYEKVGTRLFGGFADDSRFIVGRFGTQSMRESRLRHELGHVLDDHANPGLFLRSTNRNFGWRSFYDAESVAYYVQSGRSRPIASAFNATSQAYPRTTKMIVIGGTTYILYEASDELLWLVGIGQ